jgi:hypothetical protein
MLPVLELLQMGHSGAPIDIGSSHVAPCSVRRRIHAALTIPKRFGRNGAVCHSLQALIKVDGTFA